MDPALRPLAAGDLTGIGTSALQVQIAPSAGGRIAQVACDGVEWLAGYDAGNSAALGWGCYPMLPWAGRIRDGRFDFDGREWRLPATLGPHATHGVGFVLPWEIAAASGSRIELALELPQDESWPFGGHATQVMQVQDRKLRLELRMLAGSLAMPLPVVGWHPWFRKPERLEFLPTHHYPRDAAGIARAAVAGIPPSPWDDCFISARPVILHRAGQALRLCSDCDHWVVFDERGHATCVEPQTGPPDAFNLLPGRRLAPGEAVAAWFELEWL